MQLIPLNFGGHALAKGDVFSGDGLGGAQAYRYLLGLNLLNTTLGDVHRFGSRLAGSAFGSFFRGFWGGS